MKDTMMVRAGVIGFVIAMLCCVTPILVLSLGALGLSAWLAFADYVLVPAMLLFVAAAAFGYWRKQRAAAFCDTGEQPPQTRPSKDRVSHV